jgi:uncharacterized protein (DUF2267 family)
MSVNIGKYVEEANSFFKNVAIELGNSNDIDHATRVTTAVLHTLRERISPEESLHLISQLPMILKGIYVDGWKITRAVSDFNTVDEFLDEVRAHSLRSASRDFGNDEQARDAVRAVLKVINQYVSIGEIEHVKAQLPEPIAALFD